MVRRRQRWSDLRPRARWLIVAASAIQLGLFGAAFRDLRRRSADEINGDRRVWTAALFVNFIGPLAYFRFGRRRRAR